MEYGNGIIKKVWLIMYTRVYNRNCTTSQDVVNFVRQRLINMKDGKPISEESKDRPQTLSLICEEVCQ